MKISMNLLPERYVGVRRNKAAIYVLVILLLVSAAVHAIWGFVLKKERKIVTKQFFMDQRKKEMDDLDKAIKREKQEINKIKAKLIEEAIPQEELEKVADKIAFINEFLGEKSLSWFEFFHELEMMSPEHLVIKSLEQLNQEIEPEFLMQCEAESHSQVDVFWRNMEDSVNFINIQLLAENESVNDKGTRFTSFEMKFKYSPIVTITLDPAKVTKPTGTTHKFTVIGTDLLGNQKPLPRKWCKWELVPIDKDVGYMLEDPPGVFKAQQKGRSRLKVTSPDEKLEAFAEVEVEE